MTSAEGETEMTSTACKALKELLALYESDDMEHFSEQGSSIKDSVVIKTTNKMFWEDSELENFLVFPIVVQTYEIRLHDAICDEGTRAFGIEDSLSGWGRIRVDEGEDSPFEDMLDALGLEIPWPYVPEPIPSEVNEFDDAITILRQTLDVHTVESDPEGWARTQSVLARVLETLGLSALQEALEAVNETLEVSPSDAEHLNKRQRLQSAVKALTA
jgi:hypothetical protein